MKKILSNVVAADFNMDGINRDPSKKQKKAFKHTICCKVVLGSIFFYFGGAKKTYVFLHFLQELSAV